VRSTDMRPIRIDAGPTRATDIGPL
jgi:hypothetical protein